MQWLRSGSWVIRSRLPGIHHFIPNILTSGWTWTRFLWTWDCRLSVDEIPNHISRLGNPWSWLRRREWWEAIIISSYKSKQAVIFIRTHDLTVLIICFGSWRYWKQFCVRSHEINSSRNDNVKRWNLYKEHGASVCFVSRSLAML